MLWIRLTHGKASELSFNLQTPLCKDHVWAGQTGDLFVFVTYTYTVGGENDLIFFLFFSGGVYHLNYCGFLKITQPRKKRPS